ncbi:hypothetical protein QYE76_020966 [Lolium multiflorum]|uniref:Uncharacterized protein n=1 Tax=Lolium multiflorum TaxID=4521 RepID=A0AAD8R9Q3_LOLMU|nr:hypothetical protein QYE76_020961 [Lolium multiflorum]KAK1615449.1 hypothetical protein QYE76_020966 [Lolium multiflorum]
MADPSGAGSEAARLFCQLCFSSTHSRSSCRLVTPATLDAAAVDMSDGEEEDPEELIFEEDVDAPQGQGAAGQLLQAAAPEIGGAFPPVAAAGPLEEEEEEDPEELVFEDGSSDGNASPSAVASEGGPFLPISDAADFLPVPDLSSVSLDSEDLAQPERPDHVDVFMPRVNMRHFDNLAYAFAHSSVHNLDQLIFQAADLGCGPDRVSIFPSSIGTRLAVFSTPQDREDAVSNGPFIGGESSVFFRRHDETDNRFLFEHESLAALSLGRYPVEQWQRHLISHSSGPFANPHAIDPVCLTGVDFSAVLVTVKAETLTDIPLSLCVKNHCSSGSFSDITIFDFEDIAPDSSPSSGPDSDPIPEAYSSGDEQEGIELEGGAGYAEVMQVLGVPPPLVPHGEPHSTAPAASIASRAIACAPPLPLVVGKPILSKPKSVEVKLRFGFFDVVVSDDNGQTLSFRLPLRQASSDPGCKGLLVANFATASAGLVDSIATVGALRCPMLSVKVLARGEQPCDNLAAPVDVLDSLVMGRNVEPASSPVTATPPVSVTPPLLSCAEDATAASATLAAAAPSALTSFQPRRCARFAKDGMFLSIVDRAVLRKKALHEGTAEPPRRRGELSADDLLAVAIDEGVPLVPEDVQALATACDIPASELGSDSVSAPSTAGSP